MTDSTHTIWRREREEEKREGGGGRGEGEEGEEEEEKEEEEEEGLHITIVLASADWSEPANIIYISCHVTYGVFYIYYFYMATSPFR